MRLYIRVAVVLVAIGFAAVGLVLSGTAQDQASTLQSVAGR